MPEALKELVSRCWDADYDKRPEMIEVIEEMQKILKELPAEPSMMGHGGAAGSGSGCCSVQ